MQGFGILVGTVAALAAYVAAQIFVFPVIMNTGMSFIEVHGLNNLAATIVLTTALATVFAAPVLAFFLVTSPFNAIATAIAEERARRKTEEEDRQRHRDEQQEYRKQMIALGEQSIVLFESMPKHLGSAENYLDQAEVDFADGAFAPFWDCIENAAKTLGRFAEGVHHINDSSSRYSELIKKHEDTPPKFPLERQSVTRLGVGTTTAERMQAVVRKAQRNFQFAMIYEQRKTNQILVAGFTNLAQALKDMTWQLMVSINDLASSIDGMTSTLEETANRHLEEVSEAAMRERKALEMLDNIQRGRRPFP